MIVPLALLCLLDGRVSGFSEECSFCVPGGRVASYAICLVSGTGCYRCGQQYHTYRCCEGFRADAGYAGRRGGTGAYRGERYGERVDLAGEMRVCCGGACAL